MVGGDGMDLDSSATSLPTIISESAADRTRSYNTVDPGSKLQKVPAWLKKPHESASDNFGTIPPTYTNLLAVYPCRRKLCMLSATVIVTLRGNA